MGAESMVEQRGYRAGPEIRLITDSRRVEHRQNRQRAIWKNNAEGDDKPLADSVVGLGIVQEWRAADRRRKRRHLFEANGAACRGGEGQYRLSTELPDRVVDNLVK